MLNFVYITGIGHSGTTLLNLILGAHRDVLGTGEALRFFRQHTRNSKVPMQCSCGENSLTCPFWSEISKAIDQRDIASEEQYHSYFINKCRESGHKIIADSSKDISFLPYLKDLPEIKLKAIFLVKDVRSWSYSIRRRAKNAKYFNRWRHSYIYLFYNWFKKNEKIMLSLKKQGIDYTVVSYNDLCNAPEETIKPLCDFIGIKFNTDLLQPNPIKQHFINGNHMRLVGRTLHIKYDNEWLNDKGWIIPYFLMSKIINFKNFLRSNI